MKALPAVFLALILLLGCRKDIQTTEAVRQGVIDYLKKRTDLMAMDVKISGVKFNNNQADALVYVTAKSGPAAGSGMEMRYVLERQGDRWVVKPRSGASPHAGADTPAPSANPHGGTTPALPPGHPQVPSGPEK